VARRPAGPAREHLLTTAERLFARRGFGPTTLKQLGAAAELNPALIYYYFGSKSGLYRAVLERVVRGMLERGGAAFDRAASPVAAVRALVRAQMEFVLTHPHAPHLLVRELIDHEARRAEAVLLQVASGLFERLCRMIEQGQRAGLFRADLEPRFAAISTIAQVVYFSVARPAIGIFFGVGKRGVSAATARRYGRHAGEFAVRALLVAESAS
jgi:TetR/AcrR family transcriptional regulator